MTAPKTLTLRQEQSIKEATRDLTDLERVQHLMSPAAYRAIIRERLRRLVKSAIGNHIAITEVESAVNDAIETTRTR